MNEICILIKQWSIAFDLTNISEAWNSGI